MPIAASAAFDGPTITDVTASEAGGASVVSWATDVLATGLRATDVRTVPAGYARAHVELAYATTVYGAQGETTHAGHLMLGEHSSAASAYVAMTRGRANNIAHLVADHDHRQQENGR